MKAKSFLAAVSGGPDSMCLLDKYKRYIKVVCHINYKKRKSADRDQKIVEAYCKNNKIILEKLICTKKVYDSYKINNFEAKAREIRYDFFSKIGLKYGVNEIFVAHNKDDFVETAIMQEQRKSRTLFFGIRENTYKNLKIVRPILNMRKYKTEEYCKKYKVEYGIDETNFLDIYTRNKIRKELTKLSDLEFSKIYKKYECINNKNNKLEKEIEKEYKLWSTKYDVKDFSRVVHKENVIYNFLMDNLITNPNMNKVKSVINFIIKGKGNSKYRLSGDKSLLKKDGKIVII